MEDEVSEFPSVRRIHCTIAGSGMQVSMCEHQRKRPLEATARPQLARKHRPQSYNCKELAFANNNPNKCGRSLPLPIQFELG